MSYPYLLLLLSRSFTPIARVYKLHGDMSLQSLATFLRFTCHPPRYQVSSDKIPWFKCHLIPRTPCDHFQTFSLSLRVECACKVQGTSSPCQHKTLTRVIGRQSTAENPQLSLPTSSMRPPYWEIRQTCPLEGLSRSVSRHILLQRSLSHPLSTSRLRFNHFLTRNLQYQHHMSP